MVAGAERSVARVSRRRSAGGRRHPKIEAGYSGIPWDFEPPPAARPTCCCGDRVGCGRRPPKPELHASVCCCPLTLASPGAMMAHPPRAVHRTMVQGMGPHGNRAAGNSVAFRDCRDATANGHKPSGSWGDRFSSGMDIPRLAGTRSAMGCCKSARSTTPRSNLGRFAFVRLRWARSRTLGVHSHGLPRPRKLRGRRVGAPAPRPGKPLVPGRPRPL